MEKNYSRKEKALMRYFLNIAEKKRNTQIEDNYILKKLISDGIATKENINEYIEILCRFNEDFIVYDNVGLFDFKEALMRDGFAFLKVNLVKIKEILGENTKTIDNKSEDVEKFDFEVVKIFNPRQATMYIKHGLEVLKVEYSEKYDKLVFVFDKAKTKPLFDKWCKHELN